MKGSLVVLAVLLLAVPVSGQQLGLVGVDYTTSDGKLVESESEFMGLSVTYYNFLSNDWYVGLDAGGGQGDSSTCIQNNCIELESEYREFGLELGYTFGFLTLFAGASNSSIESEFSAGELEHLEVEGADSTVERLGMWAGTEEWRLRLALDDVAETKALSVGGYSRIGQSGIAASVFLESLLDSEAVEGRVIRLQIGFVF